MYLEYSVPLNSQGLLLIIFTVGYLLSSFNCGKIIKKISLGAQLAISCAITGLSLPGFAFRELWGVFLVMALLLGAGGGAIDASINTFAAHHFSITRASVNKVLLACFAAVVAGTLLITRNLSSVVTLSGIVMAGFVLAPVFVRTFLYTQNPWQTTKVHHHKFLSSHLAQHMLVMF